MQRCSLSKCASCKKVGLWQRHCHWKYYTQWMEREGGRERDRKGERRRGEKKNAGGFRKRESFEHTTKKGKEKWSTKRERNKIDRVNSSWTLSRIVFFSFLFFPSAFFPFRSNLYSARQIASYTWNKISPVHRPFYFRSNANRKINRNQRRFTRMESTYVIHTHSVQLNINRPLIRQRGDNYNITGIRRMQDHQHPSYEEFPSFTWWKYVIRY